jgi:hypothetical protein
MKKTQPTTKDELIEILTDYAKTDIEGALQVVSGVFIGLHEVYIEMRGEDGKKKIDIDGPAGQRKITIHAA